MHANIWQRLSYLLFSIYSHSVGRSLAKLEHRLAVLISCHICIIFFSLLMAYSKISLKLAWCNYSYTFYVILASLMSDFLFPSSRITNQQLARLQRWFLYVQYKIHACTISFFSYLQWLSFIWQTSLIVVHEYMSRNVNLNKEE